MLSLLEVVAHNHYVVFLFVGVMMEEAYPVLQVCHDQRMMHSDVLSVIHQTSVPLHQSIGVGNSSSKADLKVFDDGHRQRQEEELSLTDERIESRVVDLNSKLYMDCDHKLMHHSERRDAAVVVLDP